MKETKEQSYEIADIERLAKEAIDYLQQNSVCADVYFEPGNEPSDEVAKFVDWYFGWEVWDDEVTAQMTELLGASLE